NLEHISLHRKGKLADAFISYFERVFWDVFCQTGKDTGLKFFSIPFAANPLRHYPVRAAKDWDWAIATSNGEGTRAALTYKYMSGIIKKYKGTIAGFNWGKDIKPIAPDEIAQFFARAKISPNIAC